MSKYICIVPSKIDGKNGFLFFDVRPMSSGRTILSFYRSDEETLLDFKEDKTIMESEFNNFIVKRNIKFYSTIQQAISATDKLFERMANHYGYFGGQVFSLNQYPIWQLTDTGIKYCGDFDKQGENW